MKYPANYCSDNGLGSVMSVLVSMTRETVENSMEYALILFKEKKYDEALVFLNNAIEGVEILNA